MKRSCSFVLMAALAACSSPLPEVPRPATPPRPAASRPDLRPAPKPEPRPESRPEPKTAPKNEPPVVTGGGDFDTATELPPPPCKFRVHLAGGSPAQFFRFTGKAGHRVSLGALCRDKIDFALHGGDKAPLVTEFTEAGELGWLAEGGAGAEVHYLRTWPTMNYDHVVDFDLKLVDNTDAGSGRDAGEAFEAAATLPSGPFDGWLAGSQGYRGNDHVDTYKLSVKAGKTLKVRVTPPAKLGVEVSWFDRDRGRVALETSANEGAQVTVSWTPEYDGDGWLRIGGELYVGGKYGVQFLP